jgi:NADPH-dependent curcumin reductase CurA
MQYLTAYGALIEFSQMRKDACVLISAANNSFTTGSNPVY